MTKPALALTTLLLTAGCATTAPAPVATTTPAAAPETASTYVQDRKAILAMLGEYEVDFNFEETVPLKTGYEKHDDKTTGAHETVILLEDTGRFISLQHILVVKGGNVVKHWRQDWTYEADQRWEFSSDQTWTLETIAADKTAGAWTQCVYEVSDAPRYCGTGKWRHSYGNPTWTSDRTWRPLPRREYTKRKDYNALNVENRHTITPAGWTHEQDNTKTVRDGDTTRETLVREFGYNEYRKISGHDFQPAYDYWEATKAFWASVRSNWAGRIAKQDGIALTTTVDGMAIIGPMFALAQRAKNGEDIPQADIDVVLDKFTAAPGAEVPATVAKAGDY